MSSDTYPLPRLNTAGPNMPVLVRAGLVMFALCQLPAGYYIAWFAHYGVSTGFAILANGVSESRAEAGLILFMLGLGAGVLLFGLVRRCIRALARALHGRYGIVPIKSRAGDASVSHAIELESTEHDDNFEAGLSWVCGIFLLIAVTLEVSGAWPEQPADRLIPVAVFFGSFLVAFASTWVYFSRKQKKRIKPCQ